MPLPALHFCLSHPFSKHVLSRSGSKLPSRYFPGIIGTRSTNSRRRRAYGQENVDARRDGHGKARNNKTTGARELRDGKRRTSREEARDKAAQTENNEKETRRQRITRTRRMRQSRVHVEIREEKGWGEHKTGEKGQERQRAKDTKAETA